MKPTRKQTAISGFLLVLLIFGAYVIGFIGWGSPMSKTCAIPCITLVQGPIVTTVTVIVGLTSGSTDVLFSPVYSDNPVLSVVPEITTTSGTPPIQAIYSHLSFQSGTDLNWVNMPSADTEIYGDTLGDHRITVNWQPGDGGFRFGYNCPIASNTLGAYLTIQYSINQGSTWTEVNSLQRGIIDNTVCPNNSGFGSISYYGIPAAAQTTTTLLRIIGHGGGGVGDTPRFSQLWVEWWTKMPSFSNNIYQWRACQTSATCTSQPSASTTGFTIFVTTLFPPVSTITFRFTWYAGLPK